MQVIIDPGRKIVGLFLTRKMMNDRAYYDEFISIIYSEGLV